VLEKPSYDQEQQPESGNQHWTDEFNNFSGEQAFQYPEENAEDLLAELDDAVTHQPVVSQEGDCVALAVTDAPLRFRNWAVRLVQPLLGI